MTSLTRRDVARMRTSRASPVHRLEASRVNEASIEPGIRTRSSRTCAWRGRRRAEFAIGYRGNGRRERAPRSRRRARRGKRRGIKVSRGGDGEEPGRRRDDGEWPGRRVGIKCARRGRIRANGTGCARPGAAPIAPRRRATGFAVTKRKRLEQPLTSTHTKSDHPFTLF